LDLPDLVLDLSVFDLSDLDLSDLDLSDLDLSDLELLETGSGRVTGALTDGSVGWTV
jgi:hypothetical protein